jgi:adhesin transport system outer membrane protein
MRHFVSVKFWLFFVVLSFAVTATEVRARPAEQNYLRIKDSILNAAEQSRTLSELFDVAKARSTRVREAKAMSSASQYESREALGALAPQVSVIGSSKVYQYGENAYNGSVAAPAYASISSRFNLYDGAKQRSVVVQKELQNEQSELRTQIVENELFKEVSVALIELSRLTKSDGVIQAATGRIDALIKIIESIIQTDPGRRSELNQLELRRIQVALVQDNLTTKKFEISIAHEKLFGGMRQMLGSTKDIFRKIDLPVQQLDSTILDMPVVRLAEFDQRIAQQSARQSSALQHPSIDWVVQKSTQKDALDRSTPLYTAIQAQYDLFKGFSISNAERAASERLSGANQRVETVKQESRVSLATSLHLEALLTEQLSHQQRAVSAAEKIREATYRRYEAGRSSLYELLDSESSYMSSQLGQINAEHDLYVLRARLLADTGRVQWALR